MKKSLIALAAILIASAAAAQSISSTTGQIGTNSTINSSAMVNSGIGSVTSYAASQTAASASVGAASTNAGSIPGFQLQQNNAITGTTTTSTAGQVGITGTGTGVGVANVGNTWSDAGVQGNYTGVLGTNTAGVVTYVNGSGSVDTGFPTRVDHGPDLALSVNQLNTGVSAAANAGGTYSASGSVAVNGVLTPAGAGITGGSGVANAVVTNSESTSNYASQSYGQFTLNGTALSVPNGSVTVLNAGSDSTVNTNSNATVHAATTN